jgi:hypothetical protein
MEKYILTAIFALIAAGTPALAKDGKKSNPAVQSSVPVYSDGTLKTNDPYAVVQNYKIIGRDPDPRVRAQIWRLGDPNNGDNN